MVKNVAEEVLTVEKCLIKILHWWFLYQHVRKQVHHFSVHPFLTFSVSNSFCTSLFRSVSVAFLNCPPIPTPTSKGFSVMSTKLFQNIWIISYDMIYIIGSMIKSVKALTSVHIHRNEIICHILPTWTYDGFYLRSTIWSLSRWF